MIKMIEETIMDRIKTEVQGMIDARVASVNQDIFERINSIERFVMKSDHPLNLSK